MLQQVVFINKTRMLQQVLYRIIILYIIHIYYNYRSLPFSRVLEGLWILFLYEFIVRAAPKFGGFKT